MTVLTEAVLVAQYIWILRDQLRPMRWNQALLRPFVAASTICGLALVLHNRLSLIPLVCISALVYAVCYSYWVYWVATSYGL